MGKEGKASRAYAGGACRWASSTHPVVGSVGGEGVSRAQADPGRAAQERPCAEQDGPRKPFPTQTPRAGGITDRSKRRVILAWSSGLENKRRVEVDGVKVCGVKTTPDIGRLPGHTVRDQGAPSWKMCKLRHRRKSSPSSWLFLPCGP